MSKTVRVAVIGSGPAGIYAAAALLSAARPLEVDVFDRLPTPYGLVRYGVAPDHLKIKSVATTLARTLDDERVRFFGNVEYGRDLSLADLRQCYDAAVFGTGAERARDLGIPGEDLAGSLAATDFVKWYNGHPDQSPEPPLPADIKSAAVIGAGNVAIDVARMLLRERTEFAPTDIPDHVLAALTDLRVEDVYLLARRGPEHAKFTPVELRALGELSGVDVDVRPIDLPEPESAGDGQGPAKRPRGNVPILRSWADRPPAGAARRLHFRFFHRPVRILGEHRVSGLECESTGHGPADPLPVQAVIRAVGYRADALPDLPFDPDTNTIPHADGRVLGPDGQPVPGAYVAGWIKRGPTGVIGTNKSDATGTVQTLFADLSEAPGAHDPAEITDLLDRNRVAYVTREGWKRLDAYEIELGSRDGRERGKVSGLKQLLAIATGAPVAG